MPGNSPDPEIFECMFLAYYSAQIEAKLEGTGNHADYASTITYDGEGQHRGEDETTHLFMAASRDYSQSIKSS